MEILNEYQITYPKVSISLVNATSPKVLRKKIQDDEIDGAFISGACVKEGLKVEYEMQDTVHISPRRQTYHLKVCAKYRGLFSPRAARIVK